VRKPATVQDHVQEWPRHQEIQGAEHAHTGVITAAVLVADGGIDRPGMN
jgi:hypothetical protein